MGSSKNSETKDKIIETLSGCADIKDASNYYDKLVDLSVEIRQKENFIFISEILNAIGNDDRLLILESLKEKDRCVCELEVILAKTQPAVSHHLKILENVNLIQGWKKGKFTHYSLIRPTFENFNEIWVKWNSTITNWFGNNF